MLTRNDIIGFTKRAQMSGPSPIFGGALSNTQPTLGDLMMAIRADQGIVENQKIQLLTQIRNIAGAASGSTPLSALMYKGLGGIVGALIGKYFGMGIIGQAVSAMAGFGLGTVLYDKLNKPESDYPGYKVL